MSQPENELSFLWMLYISRCSVLAQDDNPTMSRKQHDVGVSDLCILFSKEGERDYKYEQVLDHLIEIFPTLVHWLRRAW